MAKPVIVSVDDDAEVLGAIERDLRRHFQSDYRIIKARSGPEGLEAVRQLKQRGSAVALFLADQRMPVMTGTEFLNEAKKLYPDARKVLLTAYADTEAAIASINSVGLDHYLIKPWDPPEERLYPVLDELLSDWAANTRLPYEGIRVAGARWSPQSYMTKEFLARNQIPYQWIDIDHDPAMAELVTSLGGGSCRLPVVFFPDGTHVVAPTNRDLAEKTGMQTRAKNPFYKLVIIGGGPAGLAAAVYGSSEGLKTLLIEHSAPGGQAGTTSSIENYLGFPSGVAGSDLARRAATQARRFGAELLEAQEVVGIAREDPYRIVTLSDGTKVSCYALVLAMGVEVKMLQVPGAESLVGIGVYYGASLTEAATYRDQEVAVVGAGNSAGQGALFFSRTAKRVTMLVRGENLEKSMSQYLIDRIRATENITVLTEVEITGLSGDRRLEKVAIRERDGNMRELDCAAMFVFIGAAPRTELVAGLVDRDEKGFILTGPDLIRNGRLPRSWQLDRDPYLYETSVPGIFAAGDVRSGSSKRVAAAVGEGSATVGVVHRYLETV
ncbi:MAG TPA: FAD-dependent oxidoreductase [Bauldia sp.]|nr:FAD-dependent oxidoreductase [Bauldia sp.]